MEKHGTRLSPLLPPSSKAQSTMAAVKALQVQVVPVRPPLKWAGGKRSLVPHIAEFWERHKDRRLVEPFCGGLAVTLSLRPHRALLNDINPHAVHFYSWLKRGLRVDDRLEFGNSEPLYYRHRKRFNKLISNGGAESAEARGAFLLPQSHLLQRPLPLQFERRVQRPLRPIQTDQL